MKRTAFDSCSAHLAQAMKTPSTASIQPQGAVLTWHPHTEAPDGVENALIAKDEGGLFLVGLAENVDGYWVSEETGRRIPEPFWWAAEDELVAMIK